MSKTNDNTNKTADSFLSGQDTFLRDDSGKQSNKNSQNFIFSKGMRIKMKKLKS